MLKVKNFKNSKNKLNYAYILTAEGIAEKIKLTKKFLIFKYAEFENLQKEIKYLKKNFGEKTMSSSSLNWVVAQLKPNMLKKAELNLLRQSFEYYAPKELYTVRKGNLFKRVKKLLFPGYIFVKINILNRDLSTLGNTLGISKVLKIQMVKLQHCQKPLFKI